MILGIDTATTVASVALVDGSGLVAEETHSSGSRLSTSAVAAPKGNHAEVLLPLIQALLQKTAVPLDRLSGIAISIGPGSFTGLRIGLATAKGIAYESGLPVVGVSTLHANAARVTSVDGDICSLLDARKNEVYVAMFRREGRQLTRLTGDELMPVEQAFARARGGDGARALRFIGDGVNAYEKLITGEFGVAAAVYNGGSLAAQVARLAQAQPNAQSSDDIGALVPVYLRSSEAETKLGKSRLTY